MTSLVCLMKQKVQMSPLGWCVYWQTIVTSKLNLSLPDLSPWWWYILCQVLILILLSAARWSLSTLSQLSLYRVRQCHHLDAHVVSLPSLAPIMRRVVQYADRSYIRTFFPQVAGADTQPSLYIQRSARSRSVTEILVKEKKDKRI